MNNHKYISIFKYFFPCIIVCILYSNELSAQWNNIFYQQIFNNTNNVYSIAYSSDNGIFVGRKNCYMLSQDNGSTWNTGTNFTTGSMSNSYINSVYMKSKSTIHIGGYEFSTGSGFYSRSIDSSLTWNCNYPIATAFSGANITDIKFFGIDTGYCYSRNKELRKTIDGGVTWQVSDTIPGGSSIIGEHMQMITKDTGYFSTNNGLYETIDGGMSVIQKNLPYFQNSTTSMSFPTTLVGYYLVTMVSGSKLYKTINGGNSWTDVFPGNGIPANLNDIYFVDKDTGYIAGAGFILKTTNGSQSWGIQHFYGRTIKKIFFRNLTDGVFTGQETNNSLKVFVYKTDNGGGVYRPFGYFYPTNSYCCFNQLCNIVNMSSAAYNFNWLLDGTSISTAFNPSSATTSITQGLHIVSLITSSGAVSDTFALSVMFAPPLNNSINSTIADSSVCQNTVLTLNLISPTTGYIYNMYDGNTLMAMPTSATNFYYSFPVDTTFILTLTATSPYALCPGNTIQKNYHITVFPQPLMYPITYAHNPLCPNEPVVLTISNTQVNCNYHLYYYPNYSVYNFPGTGGDTTFVLDPLYTSLSYYYTAVSSMGCNSGNSANHYLATYDSLTSHLSSDPFSAPVSDTLNILNTTVNMNRAYWSFPSTVTVLDTSSSFNAKIIGNISGNYPFNMIAESANGCRDTSHSFLTIFDTVAQTNITPCNTINSILPRSIAYLQSFASPATIYADENKNEYIGGFDSISINPSGNTTFMMQMKVCKYDSVGNLVWCNHSFGNGTYLDHCYGVCNSIKTDYHGNVYAAGTVTGKSFFLSSAASCGHYNFNLETMGFIVKYDSAGNCLWRILSNTDGVPQPSHFSNIEIVPNGNIFFESGGVDSILFANGVTTPMPICSIVEINSSGEFIRTIAMPDNSINIGFLDHVSSFNSQTLHTSGRFKIFNDKIIFYSLKKNTTGNCTVNLLVNSNTYTLTGLNPATYSIMGYVYITDTLGNYVNLFRAFEYVNSYGSLGVGGPAVNTIFPGGYISSRDNGQFTIDKSGNFYTSFSPVYIAQNYFNKNFYGFKYDIPGQNNIDSVGNMSIIQKWDINGNLLHHNFIGFTEITGLVANPNNNLYGIANYRKFLSFTSTNGNTYGLKDISTDATDSSDVVLFSYLPNGNFNWLSSMKSSRIDNADEIIIRDTCNEDMYFSVASNDTLHWGNNTITTTDRYQIFHFNPNGNCTSVYCIDTSGSSINHNGIAEQTKQIGSILIYPNPASETIKVEFTDKQHKSEMNYSIFNSMGILVKSGKLKDQLISIEELNDGVYCLQLKCKESSWSSSFIKMN